MKTKFCIKKDIMEAIFDTAYLIFDLVAAIIISFGCYLPVTLLSKTKGRTINDSKDLCIYVGYCDGTSAFVLKAVKE